MKKTIYILLTLVVMMVSQSCTRNNGDIGEYFGTWKVVSITINDVADENYDGNLFWLFQASVFAMEQVLPDHTYSQCWGTWEEVDGKILRLDFTHHDDAHPEGTEPYIPLPASHIPRGVIDLTIESMSSSNICLSFTDNNGNFIKYNLKKW